MPHSIDLSDLVQDGVIGLIDAAHRFDDSRGIKFETFAERRIRGAMIDALRKDAWPRGVRRVRRELEAAREKLRASLGHEPSLADLAAGDRLGREAPRQDDRPHQHDRIDVAVLERRERRRGAAAGGAGAGGAGASRHAIRARRSEDRVRNAIATLPPREQRVIALYYYNEVTMKDIGAELGVNESRVSQLHARAIRRLREALGAEVTPVAASAALARRDCGDAKPRWPRPQDGEGVPMPESDTRVPQAAQKRAGLVLVKQQQQRSGQRVARGAEQVAQPERLGEPAAAGLFEKALRVGAGHIAGHENHAPRERRRRRRHRAVELHAVDARHLEIADDQIVAGFGEAGQTLLTVAGPIDGEARIDERFRHGDRQRGLILHHQHAQSLERLERDRLLRRSRRRRDSGADRRPAAR